MNVYPNLCCPQFSLLGVRLPEESRSAFEQDHLNGQGRWRSVETWFEGNPNLNRIDNKAVLRDSTFVELNREHEEI